MLITSVKGCPDPAGWHEPRVDGTRGKQHGCMCGVGRNFHYCPPGTHAMQREGEGDKEREREVRCGRNSTAVPRPSQNPLARPPGPQMVCFSQSALSLRSVYAQSTLSLRTVYAQSTCDLFILISQEIAPNPSLQKYFLSFQLKKGRNSRKHENSRNCLIFK